MPVYQLSEEHYAFPAPENATQDGLVAIGGDLEPERLLNAYINGIFPWYEGDTIMWWSPDPRLVVFPREAKFSKSLRQTVKKKPFEIRFDTAFEDVIRCCADSPRAGQEGGTWITDEMIEAYTALHNFGFAHSVEAWHNGKLAGGLYGLAIGKVFFGESMFHKMTDASKVCFYHLVQFLIENMYNIIDAQQDTPHLRTLGGRLLKRNDFLGIINDGLKGDLRAGKWSPTSEFVKKNP